MAKKKGRSRKVLFIIAGILILLMILAAVFARFAGLTSVDRSEQVELSEVTRKTLTQVVTASGKVQPEIEVKISPDVSGEIIDLRVREGETVERGMLLARIKQDDYRAQVEQMEAGVLQAKATEAQRKADLLNAELERDRQEELYKKNAISESALQTSRTAYEVSEAAYQAAVYSVQSAEARLRESKDKLRKTTIYAPMSGTVSKLDVELGERVVGTSQMQGTEMMRIAQLGQMEMEVDVNENDVVNILVGDTAAIEIDAYPDRTFKGEVTEIANSARVSGAGTQQQITNFPVKVRIVDAHNNAEALASRTVTDGEVSGRIDATPNFRPGMSGTVDIFTRTVEDVLAVPIQAVTVRDINAVKREQARSSRDSSSVEEIPDGEDLRRVVFLAKDGEAEMAEVETGIANDTHVEIMTGIAEGDMVITGPYRAISRTLEPGLKVEKKSERGPRRGGDSG